ncbi:two-component system NtrC family sensor histidine kinase PilS protein [Halorhabdus tiamatea SARL4B]|uniref:histidine kinase n=1 Tax=Halorhabdus tiamatea SARL4B TaxID=1033806 RepID=F7PP02_9EURY|nr:ATP-binding protein [Halorhabdus tiamatea]ERJ06736.1 two-component system NtrC family sensor histidine kinase PilS protein [Halorhabdus tiamatea SARL4B]CCQ33657.1 multi-sensor signal transduction histidine kinase [Halorhabdus tiamatea SARL4B]
MDDLDRSITLLYVEDDDDADDDLISFLQRERERIGVLSVVGAETGLERLETASVDCIVSEYPLPEMNGLEFLAAVRDRYGNLPFILYTDEGSEAVASAAISAGVTDYVRRQAGPAQYERLADRIEQAVHNRQDGSLNDQSTLRSKANLLDQLFEQLPVSLYVKDTEGRHLYMSDYDLSPGDAIGKTDREVYGDDEFAREAVADDRHVVETGEPIINKEEYNENNGEWTLTSKVPWYGEDGEIKGLIGVTRFITEKKEYEREIERKNERLEKFASVVSHDLRNPLNVAIGNVDLLRQEYDDSRLERVETALDRMDQLIADILELARQGQSAFETEAVSLQALSRGAWANVETDGVELEIAGDLSFHGDHQRVVELFENIFRNVRDHAGPGTITVGPLSDATGFYVADDGPGIPVGEREDVFQPGFTTAENGTGFGLAIVSEIAEGHGWDIAVAESESGGARFEITGVESC